MPTPRLISGKGFYVKICYLSTEYVVYEQLTDFRFLLFLIYGERSGFFFKGFSLSRYDVWKPLKVFLGCFDYSLNPREKNKSKEFHLEWWWVDCVRFHKLSMDEFAVRFHGNPLKTPRIHLNGRTLHTSLWNRRYGFLKLTLVHWSSRVFVFVRRRTPVRIHSIHILASVESARMKL